MADKVLGSVDDVIIAIALGPALHRTKIRARARLCHRQAVCLFSPDTRQQIVVPLLTHTGLENVTGPTHEILKCEIGPAKFAFHQGKRHTVQATAAELLRHVGGVETLRNCPLTNLLGKLGAHLICRFHLILVGIKLLFGKSPSAVDQHLLLLTQRKIHPHLLTFIVSINGGYYPCRPTHRPLTPDGPTDDNAGNTSSRTCFVSSRLQRLHGIGNQSARRTTRAGG